MVQQVMESAMRSREIKGLKFLPEEAFIVRLLREALASGDEGVTAPRRNCVVDASSIEWGRVFETALQWNVAPMLYRLIKDQPDLLNASNIPDDVFINIKAAYIKTYMVNKTNFAELFKIVKGLTAAGVQVILLKGAHLAQFVYQDIGLRWMADIDILIRGDDLERAGRILVGMGYEYPDLELAVWDNFGEKKEVRDKEAVIEWYKTNHMHLIYCNPNAIQGLELHWGIARRASPFTIDIDGLWERARAKDVNGVKLWVLSPEDLLLHLSFHDSYCHHLKLFGLRPYCDVAAVVRRFSRQIDWEQVQARACEWGIRKYLYLTLRLSRELLGTEVPVDFLQAIRDRTCNDKIILEAKRRILGKEIGKTAFRGMVYPSEIHTFNPDAGLFKKIGFFLKRIPISREEIASRYSLPASSRRICLYYLVRFASLLFSYTRVYIPYFWYRLRQGQNHCAEFTLDLWLTSPISKK